MAYFTAVLTPDGDGWRSVDVDLEAGSPEELGDVLRGAVGDDAAVLAVLEREDEWFAFVRTDGDDTRVFVSDAVAAADSSYAELFAELPPAAEVPPPGDGDGGADDEDGPDDDERSSGAVQGLGEAVWAGDPELLADLGCPATTITRLAVSGPDPSTATVEVGELLGFAEVLEALR
ncbi:tRNA adenosine deaminase-associated protein [Paenibacillus sp. TRM 82003]|uniref:tRNA adenosine deaminase-associated protein n=1 Tax=Kineococcus sp. TRM81007 TaxID=2925831 RepID=UPI001F593B42|nr:tRNA adenosine deaminase-associated protein [Kineococcus sp. TRM81007]MCI2239500.1 tRNA adenosine deaminase-associated protein [Kineococcus sp. TRM81007]MCI3919301.1 tRNA adenosine deaminase-associated protein [Paenibacillus sp. TRM 82003]